MCVPQKYEGHSAGGLARRGKSEQSIAGGPKSLGAVAATPHTMPSICLFLGSADVPKREVPYSIDFACFIKCPDKVAVVLVNSPMLARRLDHPPHRKSFPLILLRTLLHSQKSQLLCNQGNPNSFDKTPGVGGTPQIRPLLSTTSGLFFSARCKQVGQPFLAVGPRCSRACRGALLRAGLLCAAFLEEGAFF